jgi:hypothetical protein
VQVLAVPAIKTDHELAGGIRDSEMEIPGGDGSTTRSPRYRVEPLCAEKTVAFARPVRRCNLPFREVADYEVAALYST